MKEHELKTDPQVFDDVVGGRKTFEIRKDDRGFEVGDSLKLRKTRYTGSECFKATGVFFSLVFLYFYFQGT
jgi:hypothetical protein